ncbi:DUF896 domain-containing protein [Lacticaseibacillus brantae]|uniref:UPF0291 protein FC34_GL000489 n=1 Tax=Lacticaseibacillus brantae DSM 23927 TaxID=1423727 RepID=A0A0R2B8G7_9LACO|nr:DUF896 domain-containing protein [Lacticaseibacillus brantae]KRM72779.1 hypothetical protein FC34_GL000489 [Lacticaseibacillus brantae DSM 23927]
MAEQPKERIDRINELARKDKEFGLTDEEKAERQALREAYLKDFRAGFRQTVEQTQYFDKKGNEVTPEKLRKVQREHGWRED